MEIIGGTNDKPSDMANSESIRLQIKRMGPICTSRKKFIDQVSMEEEDVDFAKQLGQGRFATSNGVDDTMWLSSGCSSPSLFFLEHELSSELHDERLGSWLSTLAKPVEDGSFAVAEAVPGKDLVDESASDGNCLQVSEMDKTSFLASLLNLHDDGSQWISNPELEFDCLQSCFPSPSFKTISGYESISCIPAIINRKDEAEESMEDFSVDEPLFWPFDRKIDWNSEETWKYFVMSPRKNIVNVTTPECNSAKSIVSELKITNIMNLPNRCRRKSVLNSGPTASNTSQLKQGIKGYNNSSSTRVKRENIRPSRLRQSAKIVPLDINNQILPLKVAEVSSAEPDLRSRNFWEDGFTSSEELPIETAIGLGEFDGHEGIDSNLNEGVFLLDEGL